MAKRKEKAELKKQNWVSQFEIIGKAVVNDYTFSLDQHSEKSDWVWSRMNLLVDCGEKYGRVGCSIMGGYGINRDNFIYVHGRDDAGRDDFSNFYTIDYEDRHNDIILRDIGNACFKTVALETDVKNNVIRKRFLSDKDFVDYVYEVLKDGMTVYVRGNINYRIYNDNVTVEKNINYIGLSNADEDDFKATFRQTVLLDEDSVEDIEKERKTIAISGYVLEKFKEFNGWDLTNDGKIRGGQFVPLKKNFEYDYSAIPDDKVKKVIQLMFKVKSHSVNQITFIGHFVEASALVKATEEDIPEDIMELVSLGIMTMDEALTDCADTSRNRDFRMVLERPYIRKINNDDGSISTQVQVFPDVYKDEDLQLDCLSPKEVPDDDFMNIPDDGLFDDDEDDDWLSKLG